MELNEDRRLLDQTHFQALYSHLHTRPRRRVGAFSAASSSASDDARGALQQSVEIVLPVDRSTVHPPYRSYPSQADAIK
jgi:hypothetical protein